MSIVVRGGACWLNIVYDTTSYLNVMYIYNRKRLVHHNRCMRDILQNFNPKIYNLPCELGSSIFHDNSENDDTSSSEEVSGSRAGNIIGVSSSALFAIIVVVGIFFDKS